MITDLEDFETIEIDVTYTRKDGRKLTGDIIEYEDDEGGLPDRFFVRMLSSDFFVVYMPPENGVLENIALSSGESFEEAIQEAFWNMNDKSYFYLLEQEKNESEQETKKEL